MGKHYAVRKGRKAGIFATWKECQASVAGFPGASFKSFATRAEAEAWIGQAKEVGTPDVDGLLAEGSAVAFTDGSFDAGRRRWGWGCVLLLPDGTEEDVSGSGTSDIGSRNVAGEIAGAMHAMRMALEKGAGRLAIFHDYAGIGEWADGGWECRLPLTKGYAAFVAEARKAMDVSFFHVKGHSGNEWNEKADVLAGKAARGER